VPAPVPFHASFESSSQRALGDKTEP